MRESCGVRDVVREEADRIELSVGRGRFRRRRTLDHSPQSESLTLGAIARAKEGDEDAIRYLYLRYADNVYGYVCSIVRDEHEAEDVTQGVFVKLPARLERYKPQLVPFSSWLMRVAHNAAIDHVRSRRCIPVEEVRDVDAAIDDAGGDRLEALRTALAVMPEDQREVLVLRFIGGLTPGEIAERMGRSENAIHALQHRGRRRLRTELESLEARPVAMAA